MTARKTPAEPAFFYHRDQEPYDLTTGECWAVIGSFAVFLVGTVTVFGIAAWMVLA